jgi:hypothetical protein
MFQWRHQQKKNYILVLVSHVPAKTNEIDKRYRSKGGQYVKLAPLIKFCYACNSSSNTKTI